MPVTRPNIYFFYETQVSLSKRSALKSFIASLFKKEGHTLKNLNYIFCSDKKLLNINREYLQHDYYTDIITFEMSDPGFPIEGEIYISVDRVRDNAQKLSTSIKNELHRVIFHGALHLCGYTDKMKANRLKMRDRENFYLNKYF